MSSRDANCIAVRTYISLPLALLRLRWWVLGPLASLEGVLGMVKRCGWCNRDVYYAPNTVQWRCKERGVVVVVVMVAAGARRQASIIIITVVLSMQARYCPPIVLAPLPLPPRAQASLNIDYPTFRPSPGSTGSKCCTFSTPRPPPL